MRCASSAVVVRIIVPLLDDELRAIPSWQRQSEWNRKEKGGGLLVKTVWYIYNRGPFLPREIAGCFFQCVSCEHEKVLPGLAKNHLVQQLDKTVSKDHLTESQPLNNVFVNTPFNYIVSEPYPLAVLSSVSSYLVLLHVIISQNPF